MAKRTSDDTQRICPHCGHAYQPEAGTYSEDVREEDCEKCGRTYSAYDSFWVTHYAVAIDPVDIGKEGV